MKRAKAFTYLLIFILTSTTFAQTKQGWWSKYDYSQISSQVISRGEEPAILRGRAVKLDVEGQKISAFYDTGDMNLRYVSLGSIEFQGTPWDGKHGGNSQIGGELLLSSKANLAWAYKGSWKDPRDFDYAPVPDQYVEFKGSYRFNDKAIFHYTVGDQASEVFEYPWAMKAGDGVVFVRQFKITEAKEELLLKVLDNDQLKIGQDLYLNSSSLKVENDGKGLSFVRVPEGSKNLSFYIAYSKKNNFPKVELVDISGFLKGGDIRWPEIVKMSGQLKADENDSFVTDQIPLPVNNPYGSKIRFGGFDFFEDGKSAAFCTWNGDVWIATGIDKELKNIVWKRYAAGLNEALGIRIVDDVIYVTGKDQITRLIDLNNDGEADYYECFNNDIKITKNFHEFTFDLQTDKHGNFYIAKGAPVRQGGRGFDVTHENHGVVYKISPDGEKSEIFYSGLRAPGGLSINEEGTIATTGENEGTYVPACKINYGKKGDFMGVIHPGNGRKEEQGYTKPLCFLPMSVDNSGGAQLWIPKGSWGDLGGT